MSSTTTNQYTYQKPSTLATRTLVTSGDKPKETPSSSSPDMSSGSGSGSAPTLQRRPTSNYADAVAAAASTPPGTMSSENPRPGLDRQQSWKMQDLKREHAEKMLGGQVPGENKGYSTTQK